jgi:hypothetical protein
MPLQINRSLLTFKQESAYGVAPTGSYTPVRVRRNPELAPMVADRLAREEVKPWLGGDFEALINKRQTISFSVYDGGSGVAGTAPAYGGLYLACGMNESIVSSTSVTYAPISAGIPSVTIRWYTDGVLHQLSGAYGTCTWMRNSGEFPQVDFEFTGLYTDPIDSALLSPVTWENQADSLAVNSSHTPLTTLNSVQRCMSTYQVSLGNNIVYKDEAGCTERIRITQRTPEGEVQYEDALIATQNVYTLAKGTTLVPVVVGHTGGPAGSRSTITVPNANILEPSLPDRDDERYITVPFAPLSPSGSSELSVVYT